MSADPKLRLEFGPFVFDVRNRVLTRDAQPVALKPKTAELLLALLNGRGNLVTKEELLKTVWPDTFVEEGNLAYYIYDLRSALRHGQDNQQYVETRPRLGYRISVPVRDVPAPETQGAPSLPPPATDLVVPGSPPPQEQLLAARVGSILLGVATLAVVAAGLALSLHIVRTPQLHIGSSHQITADRRDKNTIVPLFTDGANVYFRHAASGPGLAVPLSGGESTVVAEPLRDLVLVDVHAGRGEFLAFVRSDEGVLRQLWAATAAGNRRALGTLACGSAAWSPSGETIAYTTETGVNLASAEGTPLKDLARVNGRPWWPRWSPDGKSIRFTVATVVNREPRQSLWEVNADGTGLRALALGNEFSSECCGAWTADGAHFVFESRREARADLWVTDEGSGLLRRASTKPQRLTAGPLSFVMPGMTPDGSHILALGIPEYGELVRFDRGLGAFVPHLGGMSAVWVTYSRDGSAVAYTRFPEKTLWTARADGSQPRQLTFRLLEVEGAAWSPDGQRIAFRAALPGRPFKVFTISAEGGEPQPLIDEDREQGIPSWSADGSRLVFGEVPMVYGHAVGQAIQTYHLAERKFSTLAGSTNLWSPRWSPDGRYIAAVTIAGRSLKLFDVARGSWSDLDAHRIDNATWSRDSGYIYYHTEGDVRALRRVRIPDGAVEQITSLDGYPIKAYWWSGLALDGSPLVLRTAGSPEIYALEVQRK